MSARRIEAVALAGPAGALEAQWMHPATPRRGAALLCHPHPLHGGTLHTKAVYHAARGLAGIGLPVLRFNFRGVGRSAGTHDFGAGERDDARTALAAVVARHAGEPLIVGGFSFGSWVGCAVGQDAPAARALVAIGPPLDLYDFGFVRGDRPILCIAGDRDAFCSVDALRAWTAALGDAAETVILHGAQHLLTTHLRELETAVADFARRALA